jgi:hypothetical protein
LIAEKILISIKLTLLNNICFILIDKRMRPLIPTGKIVVCAGSVQHLLVDNCFGLTGQV